MAEIKPSEVPAETPTQATQPTIQQSEVEVSADAPYFYCLEENHPGAPNFQTTPLSLTRIFQSEEEVPVCPACGKQTNSISCAGPDIPPEFILELQDRFGR